MPTTKPTLMKRQKNAQFIETGHDEEWQNTVAKELNILSIHVGKTLEQSPSEDVTPWATASLNIIDRVADFEQIKLAT
jgi:hypothetical protein